MVSHDSITEVRLVLANLQPPPSIEEQDLGINVLHPQASIQDEQAQCSVDVVAIHGIGAHPLHTWSYWDADKSMSINWLKDDNMLHQDLPDARIMTFGYRSNWNGSQPSDVTTTEIAKRLLDSLHRARKECQHRPIIFVAHCVGGLVLMKAMVFAYKDEPLAKKYDHLFGCTVGMIFMGTPFRGAHGALADGYILRTAQAKIDKLDEDKRHEAQIIKRVLEILEPGNETLENLRSEFLEIEPDLLPKLICFYESQPANVWKIIGEKRNNVPEILVPRSSATLDRIDDLIMYTNHFQMNKFQHRDYDSYQTVIDKLTKFLEADPLVRIRHLQARLRLKDPWAPSPQDFEFDDKTKICLDLLFLTDPYDDRESLISTYGRRVAGTCDWIRDDEAYRRWLQNETSLLWISGGPGKGKTTMSIFLTEELDRLSKDKKNAELIFYFCSFQDEKRKTVVAILRSLLHQILRKHPNLTKYALPRLGSSARAQITLNSLESLWLIIMQLLQDPEAGTIFCVLNGLDECDADSVRVLVEKLVNYFSSISAATSSIFKLIIVSRDISELHGVTNLKLDPDHDYQVAGDIERFISVKIQELSKIPGFDASFRVAVQKELLNRAEGTFLWVGFVVAELSKLKTCTEVLAKLQVLPTGLPAIYSRMLHDIPAKERLDSFSILQWVTMAIRPLKLSELAEAIGIEPKDKLSIDRAVRDKIAFCGPLIKVHDGESSLDVYHREVSLVHQSAKDYLLRNEPDDDKIVESFRIRPEEAHLKLAKRCINSLEQYHVQQGQIPRWEEWSGGFPEHSDHTRQRYPLFEYAFQYWPDHTRESSEIGYRAD